METQQQSTQLEDFLTEVAWKLRTEGWTVINQEKTRTLVKDGIIHQNESKGSFKIKDINKPMRAKRMGKKAPMRNSRI